ncbi:MAG: hypothetical protein E4H14_14100 [Candidatus Thorarchaeota archaeon]|nr:MAG: hypothetical protein E4H14_14100 [Candidatus Thorarchaeota archaeon]
MKHVKMTFCIMLISVLLVSMWVPMTNPTASNKLSSEKISKDNHSPYFAPSYESHSAISIAGDDDFNTTAVNEGWLGDGSSDTPFIIEGYEITGGNNLISIVNTQYHFEIRDCNLTDANAAIGLLNVTNGLIENCLIDILYYGLDLENVTGINVVGCDIIAQSGKGIYMDEAFDCSIESCVIQGEPGSDAGIFVQWSEGITLFNNTVFEFDNHGIFFDSCYDMDILNNTLYWNEGSSMLTCAIYLIESDLAYIYGNNITENSDNGITLSDANNVTIIENHLVDNWIHGVYVEFSDYCIIQDNFIEGSGDGILEGPACGISTYFADYIIIDGNEFWYNDLNSITLAYSNFGYISNNYLNHSFNHGMWIYNSPNATIEKNEIYNAYALGGGGPTCGILIEESDDTSLLHNILGNNADNGITVQVSDRGNMIGNTIYESDFNGIFMSQATDWNISYNIIYDNGGPGIYMEVPTQDNLLYYNDIGWSGEFLAVDEGFGNFWNYSGIGNWYSDYEGTGTYTITGASSEVDYYPSMSLYLGTTTPVEYEVGTTGNTMSWAASALNPGIYELLVDGVSQGHLTWDGGAIHASVDGLPVGTYNVTLIVYHVSGHSLSNQSTLTVVDTTAPTWTVTPTDQTLEYNEPLSYQLQASDPSGIASWAVNDTANFAISSSGLLTNATTLAPGIYYLEITVTDEYSHSVSVTIMVTVNEPAVPYDSTTLVLAVGGIGAGVIIILLVIVFKKKTS